jgi:hypothetical protein
MRADRAESIDGEQRVEHYLELARIAQQRHEPLKFAHAIRHVGDFLRRAGKLDAGLGIEVAVAESGRQLEILGAQQYP